MARSRKTGRTAAEAAYAALLQENTTLVGDVGEAWDDLDKALTQAAVARERYEDARSAAVKGGAVTNDQLDQMGYTKPPKTPTLPPRAGAGSSKPAAPAGDPQPEASTGAGAAPHLVPSSAPNREVVSP